MSLWALRLVRWVRRACSGHLRDVRSRRAASTDRGDGPHPGRFSLPTRVVPRCGNQQSRAQLDQVDDRVRGLFGVGDRAHHTDDKVKISKRAWSMKGSRMFVEPGSEVRVEDLPRGDHPKR